MKKAQCIYCKNMFDRMDLRPYAKGGELTCYTCMKQTPEREAEARRLCQAAFDSAGPMAAITEEGVKPLKKALMDEQRRKMS